MKKRKLILGTVFALCAVCVFFIMNFVLPKENKTVEKPDASEVKYGGTKSAETQVEQKKFSPADRSASEVLPPIGELSLYKWKMACFDFWAKKGFQFSPLVSDVSSIGEMDLPKQLQSCLWLKITLGLPKESVLRQFELYGCKKPGERQYNPLSYIYFIDSGEHIKGMFVAAANKELRERILEAFTKKRPGLPFTSVNFLAGDYVGLRRVDLQPKVGGQREMYLFSSSNPYTLAQIPLAGKNGGIYEYTFDVKAAIEYEREAKLKKEEKRKENSITITLGAFGEGRHVIFYWDGGKPKQHSFNGKQINIPRTATGAPVAIFNDNQEMLGYIKKMTGTDIRVPEDADWAKNADSLVSIILEIPRTYLQKDPMWVVTLNSAKPDKAMKYVPIAIGSFRVNPVDIKTEPNMKISLDCFPGQFWVMLRPANTHGFSEAVIAQIVIKGGVKNQVITIDKLFPIPNLFKSNAGDDTMQNARRRTCIAGLKMIWAAKRQWAINNKKHATDIPSKKDLDPYITGGFSSLKCPSGGTYTIRAVGEKPTCSIPGHELK